MFRCITNMFMSSKIKQAGKRYDISVIEAGISRDKTMDDKLIFIPNDDKQILFVKKFGHCHGSLNQPIKIQTYPKCFSQRMRECVS